MQVWVRVQNRRSLGLGHFRYPQEQITDLILRDVEHRRGVLKNVNCLKTLVQASWQFIQSARFRVELIPPPLHQGLLTMSCYVVGLTIPVVGALGHVH
jgi:hypothetical protein